MKVLTDEKKEDTPYTVSEYPHFLNAWTKLDTFYFQILNITLKAKIITYNNPVYRSCPLPPTPSKNKYKFKVSVNS